MRANGNPDFFAGLPMQTAQRVLKEAADVFGAWQSALKEYGCRPWKFTGRPRMPKYLKGDSLQALETWTTSPTSQNISFL